MGTVAQRATPGGRRLAALVVAALAVAITACGEDEPMAQIPRTEATAMLDLLDQARAAAEAGDCTGARAAADEFIDMVNLLKAEDVETEVKEAMRAAGFRLEELINEQCEEPAAATDTGGDDELAPSEEPTTEETTTEETPEEEPTETETEADTGDEEEPPEQPPGEGEVEPPPDQGDDEGENDGPGGEDTDDDSGTGGIEG